MNCAPYSTSGSRSRATLLTCLRGSVRWTYSTTRSSAMDHQFAVPPVYRIHRYRAWVMGTLTVVTWSVLYPVATVVQLEPSFEVSTLNRRGWSPGLSAPRRSRHG